MTISGNIKRIGEVESFGNNGFTKREIIIEEDVEKYPQTFCVEFQKDNIEKLTSNLTEGQFLSVECNVRSKEYIRPKDNKAMYFVSFVGWRLNTEGEQSAPQSAVNNYEEQQGNSQEGTDDLDPLPF